MKYSPDEGAKRKSELTHNLRSRLSVFMKLYKIGMINSTALDTANVVDIVKTLDSGTLF